MRKNIEPYRKQSVLSFHSSTWALLLACSLCCVSCRGLEKEPVLQAAFPLHQAPTLAANKDSLPTSLAEQAIDYDSSQWQEITTEATGILLDIRYATTDNFMQQKVYDCGRCFYRPAVAKALARAQESLRAQGLGLKMYDCYRPAPYQQRLWDIMPDARYVARPEKGSVHSRGAATDLTLVYLDSGKELDMGTPYDFFGEAAYTTTTNLPEAVLANRKTLQEAMLAQGFLTIRTEWWHFNFSGPRHELSDWVWPCR